jgi:mono/diheme cytochrome c family protein
MTMRTTTMMILACAAGLGSLVAGQGPAVAGETGLDARVARGKYLVTIGGCNDCHTPGYGESGGQLSERDWLVGSPVGFQGPWGTTYAANLRQVIGSMSESEWVAHARKQRLPPMPWFNLARMTDPDLRAMYAYVKSLGPAGWAAPAYVAPGGKVTTPYIVFVPQVDAKQAAR